MEKGPYKKNQERELKKQIKLKWLLAGGLALLMVLVLTSLWFLRVSQETTEKSVYDVSELYLEELTQQKINQLQANVDSQIQQINASVNSVMQKEKVFKAALQDYVKRMKNVIDFDYYALVDEKGVVYTEDNSFIGENNDNYRNSTKPIVMKERSTDGEELIVVYVPLKECALGGKNIVAAVGGIDMEVFTKKLSLENEAGEIFCEIVDKHGNYVIRTNHIHLNTDKDLFSSLEENARFAENSSLEQMKMDLEQGKAGLYVYYLQDIMHYTYYAPVEGTSWFVKTTIHYDLVNKKVGVIRTTLERNSMIQLALVIAILLVLFGVYLSVHRRNESLQLEKIQAEESSRAKSIFLSHMSHDIRTPMNAIIGFTNLAVKSGNDVQKIQEYLAKILASSNHLLTLINDVLEMSRIESGKIYLDESECNLSEILHDIKTIIIGQIHGKQQKLVMDTVNVVNEDVYCDRLRLNQVLLNLLGNAIKFTPPRGQISVCIEQKEEAPVGFGAYEIRVKDTGIGMSKEFAANVFKPFERERTSTVSGIQGTGLGMSITKNIIDLMEGTIDVVTAPGEGTEYIIRVNFRLQENQKEPAASAEQALSGTAGQQFSVAEDSREEKERDFRGKRILLVEDNELNREIAREILEDAGIEVEEAENGAIAVEKIRNSSPGDYDVVLMDIQMPVMDGYEAARAIRSLEEKELSSIVIVAMTANAFVEDKMEALAAGMNGHIAKPLDVDLLFETLHEIFNANFIV